MVKDGGNAMISENLRRAVLSDIVLLHQVGIQVVVVHGGGPEISAMLKKILGKEGVFVNGLRYTDEETMDIVLADSLPAGQQGFGLPDRRLRRQGHGSVRHGRADAGRRKENRRRL